MLLNHRYRILKTLTESSLAKTFIAADTQHPNQQQCVIKQIKPHLYNTKNNPQLETELIQAATKLTVKLTTISQNHPQLPNIQTHFIDQGLFYLVYEWIEGTAISKANSLPWSETAVTTLVNSLLDALSHLQNHQLIHPNLNPDNIIISTQERHPHLINFGAIEAITEALLTQSGTASAGASVMVKTRGFLSPEQAIGKPKPSSNLYSLGMIAIYLLTGKSPLQIPTDQHNGRLLWQQFAPNVSDRTASILTRAIHTNPSIRFSSAAEMQSVLTQTPIAQTPITQPAKTQAEPNQTLASAPTRIAQANIIQRASEKVVQSGINKSTVTNSLEATEVSLNPNISTPNSSLPGKSSATAVAVASQPSPSSRQPQSQQKQKKSIGAKIDDFFKQIPLKWVGLSLGGAAIATGIFTLGSQTFSNEETIQASSLEQIENNISSIEEQLENNPNDETLHLQLAENYTYAGDITAAESAIETALNNNESSADALYQKGRLRFYQSDYEGAIEQLTAATEQNERHMQATVMLGRAHQETGEYSTAQSLFETATRLKGNKGDAYLNLSYLHNLQGNIRAAIDSANQAARHFKGDAMIRAYTQLGTLHFDLKNIEKAEENWQNAIALTPQNPEAYVIQSISHFFLSDSESALGNIEQALAINPNFTEAYAMRSLVHLNQGEINPAVEAIDQAVALDEYSVSTLKIIADVALSLPEPNPDFAFSAINQALEINPNSPYILNQRCNVLMSTRQIEDAIADCTRSIEINPNNIEAYNTRGQAYLAATDFTSAEADFTRIIEINDTVGRPQDAAAYAQRAVARTGLQNAEGAKADLDTALELNSQL